MKTRVGAVMLVMSAAVGVVLSAASRGVTHEDIRDAILSFVHMFRDSTDKLERHEYRERQLGEQLKKALAGIDKRQRSGEISIESLTGAITRVEERLRRIEAAISQKDEREKGTYTVDTMQESLQSWMLAMEGLLLNQTGAKTEAVSADRMDALEAAFSARLDSMSAAVERLEAHMLRSTPSTGLVSTDSIVTRVEAKLVALQPPKDWHKSVQAALDNQFTMLQDLKNTVRESETKVAQLVNTTQDALQELKYELAASTESGVAKLEVKMADMHTTLSHGQEELLKMVTDTGVMAEGLYADVQKSYDQLLNEVKGLAKVEQVLIQTADNVLDTKRRIEYGVHQILLEVGDLVKLHSKDLNNTVNRRFDNISATILENQNGALTNLSSKIETEISQVWRQIGIMYQQLTASAGALDRLQQQTEMYVNGSLQTMDSMEGKVGQITGRMSEVDENLNYLLGRLSLVTQEFNQIKTGLGDALDNIRSSFLAVQDKIKQGPGPNPIESSENPLTEVDNHV